MIGAATVGTLEHLLAPYRVATFFERWFEREPLHIVRGDAGYFSALYAIADIETALHVGAPNVDRFTMTNRGTPVDAVAIRMQRTAMRAEFTGRAPAPVIDPRAIVARVAQGQTLVISDAALFSPALQQLCNRIQRETLMYVQVNAYLTPSGAQGFSLHYDTHDTLVVQIEGAKHWRVYDPLVPLPIESQPSGSLQTPNEAPRVFDLHAGDTLSVPRGYRHECTAGSSRSLHLTFAFLPVRAIEYARAALSVAATTDVELRRSLEFGWQDSSDFPERFGAAITERLRSAFSQPVMDAARELIRDELFAATRVATPGAFADLERLEDLAASTRIALRDDAPFTVRPDGNEIQLVIAGKATALPSACETAIRRLDAGPASVAELDGIVPGSGSALARLLIRDGLATILDP
jgi:hypothetical protein